MTISGIRFTKPFVSQKRIKLPPSLPQVPKGRIMAEGYKVFDPNDSRRTVGFYLPKHGVYNMDGENIGKISSGRKACRFQRERMNVYLVDKDNKRVALVSISKLRLVLDKAADRVVGILQPLEIDVPSPNLRSARIIKAIDEFMNPED